MNKKSAMIFAVIIAVAAVVLIQLYVSGVKSKYTDESKLTTVLVAKVKISEGTPIEKSMLKEQKLYTEYIPKDAIKVSEYKRILGLAPKTDIGKGEPIQSAHFREGGIVGLTSRFLSGRILEGERAITIRVDEESGVAGLIRPGDFLDITGTFKKPGSQPIEVTKTVLQNVPVLAIGSQVGTAAEDRQSRSGRGYRTITLSVTPEEAELIEFCRRKTKLIFLLRNAEDRSVIEDLPEINYNNLFKEDILSNLQKKRNMMNKKRIEIVK